jgi:hypothetical protein
MIVINSTNINKTKESLNSDGHQFHQYQQNKRKFKQWWSSIPPISIKQTIITLIHTELTIYNTVLWHCIHCLYYIWWQAFPTKWHPRLQRINGQALTTHTYLNYAIVTVKPRHVKSLPCQHPPPKNRPSLIQGWFWLENKTTENQLK